MPLDQKSKLPPGEVIYFRRQYAESILTRTFYDYRDRQVFSFIKSEHKKIVDVGCGEGITLESMMRVFPGREICGIDIEDENIAICREHGLPARHSSAYELQFADDFLDCCIMTDVIEHLDDPEKFVRELHRVLRPGGRAIIVFPHDRVFTIARLLTLKWKGAFYFPGHVRQWTPKSMAGALHQADFTIYAQRNLPFVFWPLSLYHMIVADKTSKVTK